MNRSRAFCLTINNYTQEDVEQFGSLRQHAIYSICGREAGERDTEHLQCYLYFQHARTLSSIKKACPRAHIELARGSPAQNQAYCSKEGDFDETGELPISSIEKGKLERNRWTRAWELAKENKIEEIDDDIRIRCYRTLKEIRKDYMARVDDLSTVCGVWYVGPPGVGKSHAARSDFPDAYIKPLNKWWDGFQNEKNVILDDLDKVHSVLGHHLKIWSDKYAFIAETKGGGMRIRPERIIVTSNYYIEQIWDDPVLVEALRRRFTIIEMDSYPEGHPMFGCNLYSANAPGFVSAFDNMA